MKLLKEKKTITTTKNKANTITTNKTLIYKRQSTYRERERERERENTYLLLPNYKKTTLSNMQRKHHVH